MVDKSADSKVRETRAADFSVSVNLDVKKENPGSKLKKKNRLKMKKNAETSKIQRRKRKNEEAKNGQGCLKTWCCNVQRRNAHGWGLGHLFRGNDEGKGDPCDEAVRRRNQC